MHNVGMTFSQSPLIFLFMASSPKMTTFLEHTNERFLFLSQSIRVASVPLLIAHCTLPSLFSRCRALLIK